MDNPFILGHQGLTLKFWTPDLGLSCPDRIVVNFSVSRNYVFGPPDNSLEGFLDLDLLLGHSSSQTLLGQRMK